MVAVSFRFDNSVPQSLIDAAQTYANAINASGLSINNRVSNVLVTSNPFAYPDYAKSLADQRITNIDQLNGDYHEDDKLGFMITINPKLDTDTAIGVFDHEYLGHIDDRYLTDRKIALPYGPDYPGDEEQHNPMFYYNSIVRLATAQLPVSLDLQSKFDGAVANPKYAKSVKQYGLGGISAADLVTSLTPKCFAKGTSILMADGRQKQIEEIEVNDFVSSFNGRQIKGTVVPRRVVRLYRNITDEWIELRVHDEAPIFVTPGHSFFHPEGGFFELSNMIAEAERMSRPLWLVSAAGAVVETKYVRHIYSLETADQFEQGEIVVRPFSGNIALRPEARKGWQTYNFEVEEHHAYIAGGIRVHNDSMSEIAAATAQMNNDNLVATAYSKLQRDEGDQVAAIVAQSDNLPSDPSTALRYLNTALAEQQDIARYDQDRANGLNPNINTLRQNFINAVNAYNLAATDNAFSYSPLAFAAAVGLLGVGAPGVSGVWGVQNADGTITTVSEMQRNGLVFYTDPLTGRYVNPPSGYKQNNAQSGGGYPTGVTGGGGYPTGGGQGGIGNSAGGGAGPTGGGLGTSGGEGEKGSGGSGGSSASGSSPIVLDLNGTGINVTQLSSSNTYEDSSGTGYKSLTAWAGVGSGVLFYDPTGQGVLTQANQYVFTDWDPSASTDMQALEDVFDTNHDGALDGTELSKFFVMVTRADGTQTAVSLSSYSIVSINLEPNSNEISLPDGSSIDGETSYTVENVDNEGEGNIYISYTQHLAATVTLATYNADYAISNSKTVNSDGSTTISNIALNPDGSTAYARILNTSSNGLIKTLSDLDGGGAVTDLQTDSTAIVSGTTKTETLVNYLGGSINAIGGVTSTGERLNGTTTTTVSSYAGAPQSITILRDQTGGAWTSQKEVDTYIAGTGGPSLSGITVYDYNPDGTSKLVTTTTVDSTGDNRTTTADIDGNANWSSTSQQTTVVGTGPYAPVTGTVTTSAGTTVVGYVKTVTTTSFGNVVTRVTTSDLTDGSTLNLTTTETTVGATSNGSTTTIVEQNADNSLRNVSVTTVDSTGLLKTTKTDSTGSGSASAPVFELTSTDNTVINSDSSRTETVTDRSANGTLRDQSVTQRSIDGISRTTTTDSTGDGLNDQTETIGVASGVVTDTLKNLAPNGTLANETVTVTSANGLTKTTSTDTTGAVGSGGAAIFDHVTTDTTTHGSDGSSNEVVIDTSANGAETDRTTTWTSANGLQTIASQNYTGAGGFASTVNDRVTTDTTTVNSDSSLIETIATVDQYGNQLSSTTKTTSSNRQLVTTTSTLGTTGLAKTVETVTTQSNGTVVDSTITYDALNDILGAKTDSTTADGLTKITSVDVTGQAAGTAIAYDEITADSTTISNDGSRTETITATSQNGSLISNEVINRSPNGLSITTSSDQYGQSWFDTVRTDVTALIADGSTTETITDKNSDNTGRDQTIIKTGATGLWKTTTVDYNDDGTPDLTTAETVTINADGSKMDVVTVTNANGTGDQATTTSGVIGAYGQTTTIADQANADSTGSIAVYSVETISTGTDGTVSDITLTYASIGGAEVFGTKATTSANGLVKTSSVDVNGDGTYDVSTVDTTTLNVDGSTTETAAKSNSAGLINETMTVTSANGLSVTTYVDDNGAASGSTPVFDRVTTGGIVLNSDGSETETQSTVGTSGTAYATVITRTSADQQTKTIKTYLDESGTPGNIDRQETIQTQTDGSIVDTTQSYGTTNSLIDTIAKKTSGNGLVVSTTYKNAAGSTTDTQTSTTTLIANGSKTDLFTDVSAAAGNSTVTTNASANGLVQTSSTSLSGPGGTASFSTTDTTTIAHAGGSTDVVTDILGSASDTTTTVISANGRTTTVSTDENGDSHADITSTTTLALDGSKSEVVDYYTPGADALAMSVTTNTSVDGRMVSTTSQSDYDGAQFNVTTDVSVANANDTTTDTLTASGSFGASGDRQAVTSGLNTDSGSTTTTITSDVNGGVLGQDITRVSANGLITSFADDTIGLETIANLKAAAADLINGTTLPSSLLASDIVGAETTTTGADGSITDVDKTFFGTGVLRSNTTTLQSANGLVTTTSIDNDGNGTFEQVDTLTLGMDGSETDVFKYFGNTTTTANTLIGSNTLTTSANGLVKTLTTSNGIVDTTTEFAGANGSYQWSRVVTAGSAAANSTTIFNHVNGSSSHMIDANGIDTWSWNDGAGHSGSITIDVATENRDIAIANEIYLTLTGQPMDDASAQYLGQYITNGVLNRTALATAIASSADFNAINSTQAASFGTSYPGYQVYEVISAFQNALGRMPTAEELSTYYAMLSATQSAANTAAMAVAVAQYASDLGASSNRTQLDANQDLVSRAPDAVISPSTIAQILAAGTFTQSNTILLDQTAASGTAAIDGNGNIVVATSGSIALAIGGNNNRVSQLGGTGISITGSNNSVAISSAVVTIASGAGTASTPNRINGNSNTINAASGVTFSVSGSGNNAVTSSATINFGSGDTGDNVTGNSDTINAASGDIFGIFGTGDNAYTSGSTIYFNSNDTGGNVVGNNDTIDFAAGDTFGIVGTGDNAYGSSATIYFNSGDTGGNVLGANNAINFADGDIFGIFGSGNTAYGSSGTIYLNSGMTSGNVSGTGNTIVFAAGDVFGVYGASNTEYGSSATIYLNSGVSSGNVIGNGNTINFAAGDVFGIYGTGNAAYGSTGTVYLNGGVTNANVIGNGDSIDAAAGDTFGIYGTGDDAFASNVTVYFNSGDTNGNVVGNNNTINVASGDTFGVFGTGNTANMTDATVYFNTANASNTISGANNTVYVASSGSTLNISSNNNSVYMSDNLNGEVIYVNNSTIYEGNYDTVDVIGYGDTVVQGTGDTNLGVGGPPPVDPNGGGPDLLPTTNSIQNASSTLNIIAQYEADVANDTGAAADAQTALFRAAVIEQVAIDFGAITSPEFNGSAWTNSSSSTNTGITPTVVTWSLADSAGSANDPFSGYIDTQYQATIEKAFNAWGAVSGIEFEEVADSAATDLRIGWGDFDTSTSGVLGYTNFNEIDGGMQPGTIVRLEDPSEVALSPNANGDLTYSGTDATLYQVALHEIGRAIGLDDNADPNSVMFASSSTSNQTLDQTDIAGIQMLYGTPDAPINASSVLTALQQIYVQSTSNSSTISPIPRGLAELLQAMTTFVPPQPSTILTGTPDPNTTIPQLAAAH